MIIYYYIIIYYILLFHVSLCHLKTLLRTSSKSLAQTRSEKITNKDSDRFAFDYSVSICTAMATFLTVLSSLVVLAFGTFVPRHILIYFQLFSVIF